MAEPDQIDFATAANARWGVVEGCQVTVTGITANCTAGVVVIDGLLVTVIDQITQIGIAGTADRFDALVIDKGGVFKSIGGAQVADPVFPDVPQDTVLLATVFCPTGAATYTSNVIDKRRFVSRSLLTKIGSSDDLVRNLNGDGNYFLVSGNGRMEWLGDTRAYRSAPKTLRIEDHLTTNGDITALGDLRAKSLIGTVSVTAPNLLQGPNEPPLAGSSPGAIWQKSDGTVWVHAGTKWSQLVTAENAIPIGTIIQSVEPPSAMPGWLQLDGTQIGEQQQPLLFQLAGLQNRIVTDASGNRTMVLPDCRNRLFMGSAGFTINNKTDFLVTIQTANLPPHKHSVGVAPGGRSQITGKTLMKGSHTHTMTDSGAHSHTVTDPGHSHYQGQYPFGAFVCLEWGGQNKLDALFNDRNHTYSVGASPRSGNAPTGISVGTGGSAHKHLIDYVGDHDHTLQIDTLADHDHTVTEQSVGGGAALDFTPPFIGFYTYIRSGAVA
jgi:hypothetical protein